MSDDTRRTRRNVLRTGASLALVGGLAGCSQDESGDTPAAESETDGAAGTDSGTPSETTTATESSYSVSIEPMGEVTFDSVPETWVANNGSWADMGIALGQEPPAGVWLPGRYHTRYYDEIPDVSVDVDGIQQLWGDSGVGKEQFYEIDADVHVLDPNFLLNRGQWDQSDIDEIATQIGPFFGNSVFSRSYDWHADYRYYTLYEAFEKLADVFQERERFEAMNEIHEEFQADLAPVVPGQSERPEAPVLWAGGTEPEEFFPYVQSEGTSFKHLRDLGVRDSLASSGVKDFHAERGAIDYEVLLDIDPELLLVRGQEPKSAAEFRDSVVSFMQDHAVASDLTAVENGDVYQAGPLYQGPITNLVVTERLARDLYGHEGELFDRQAVADVVTGDF
jgi:iron complex transport system substrate-binding protein